MHKGIIFLQMGFLLVCLKSAAMQSGDIVQDIVKSPSFSLQVIQSTQAPLEVVMTTPVAAPSKLCMIKDFGHKLILLCKKHTVAVAACIVVVAAVLVYTMVPVVKDDKLDTYGFDDSSLFPQEKIDGSCQPFEGYLL